MQLVIRLIVAIIFGTNFGALTALWFGGLIGSGPSVGSSVSVDGWASDWSIGSENANPYVRARVARNGLMAMRKEEAVYFIKAVDDQGAPLDEACTYHISGGAYPALWWSITLYDANNRLPMNTDDQLSFDQTQAENTAEAWTFQVSAEAPSDPDMAWVSSKAASEFDLMLRLYQPSDALLADPEAVLEPPRIEQLSCQAEES